MTSTGTAVATQRPARPIDVLRAEITSPGMRNQFTMALPAHVPVERFTRVAVTAIAQNPDLLNADRNSLFAACMMAAQLGLVTDGVLGQAYLVPYKGRVQLIPGYRGLLQLARQSGEISAIDVDTIHENDDVEYVMGDESRFVVRPSWGDRGAIRGAFAIAKFRDGGLQRAVMTVDEIEAIRKRAPSGNSPAWKDSYGEMCKKTAFRRLAKMLPLTTEAQRALGVADAADAGRESRIVDEQLITSDIPSDDAAPRAANGATRRLDALANQSAGNGSGADDDPETVGDLVDKLPPTQADQEIALLALTRQAEAAADKGFNALTAWWGKLTADQRGIVGHLSQEMNARATRADDAAMGAQAGKPVGDALDDPAVSGKAPTSVRGWVDYANRMCRHLGAAVSLDDLAAKYAAPCMAHVPAMEETAPSCWDKIQQARADRSAELTGGA